jgi:hypothetical protein
MQAKPSSSPTLPTRISSDLTKLIFRPKTASKHNKKKKKRGDDLDFPHKKIKISSTNKRWEMLTLLDPTENPNKKPPFTVVEVILLSASITTTKNKKRQRVSLSQATRATEEPTHVLLTKTKKHTKEIQRAIQLHHASPKTTAAYTRKNSNSHDHRPLQYPIYKTPLALQSYNQVSH